MFLTAVDCVLEGKPLLSDPCSVTCFDSMVKIEIEKEIERGETILTGEN